MSPFSQISRILSTRDERAPLAATRRRLILRAALGLTLVVLLIPCFVLASFSLSPGAMLEEVATRIDFASGFALTANKKARVYFLPRPSVVVEDATLSDRAGAFSAQVERLVANVSMLPLLIGRLEIAELALRRPRIRVDLSKKPQLRGALLRAANVQPATQEARRADEAPLGAVSLSNGFLWVEQDGAVSSFDNLEAALDWRKLGAPATLTAAMNYRAERLKALVWIARPGAILRGEQSPTTARLDGDSLHAEIEGLGQGGARPRYTGRLSFSAPSLKQALALLRPATPLPGPFENVQLTAQATLSMREMQLTGLHLYADDNEFEGSFALRRELDRASVQATLHANFVSMEPMLTELPPLVAQDGQWSKEPFDLPDLGGVDVDMRLSAAHARLSRLFLNDVALSVVLRGGRLDFSLTDAKPYNGSVKARATFAAASPSTLDIHASAETKGVDLGALLWDLEERQDVSGAVDSEISLDATGESVAALMRDLGGRARFALRRGEARGVDLERALHGSPNRSWPGALQFRSGVSPIDEGSATMQIAHGVARLEAGAAKGPGFSIALSGEAGVAERSLAFRIRAAEADRAGLPLRSGQKLDFAVSGSWDDPSFTPDTAALIKRSGAAAPLLAAPSESRDETALPAAAPP